MPYELSFDKAIKIYFHIGIQKYENFFKITWLDLASQIFSIWLKFDVLKFLLADLAYHKNMIALLSPLKALTEYKTEIVSVRRDRDET